MTITLKVGGRLFSDVCATEMIVVKAPATPVALTIGGVAPVTSADQRTGATLVGGHDTGAKIGKRYVDESGSLELLCTKGGDGVPALDGVVLGLKEAKALPTSD
jgi:hypothetical protein